MLNQKIASTILLAVLIVSSFALVGVASASTSDDWSMFRGNLNHTGASATEPAVSGVVVYITSWDNNLYALGSQVANSSAETPVWLIGAVVVVVVAVVAVAVFVVIRRKK